ncbi:hypothetical protein V2J09_000390 [Rumex salicifolius]
MISTKKLIKMAKKWQRLAVASRKRISTERASALNNKNGHFVVYTVDARRFALPLAFLQSNIFRELLRMAEEEFGLAGNGPITLPCDSVLFEYALSAIQHRVGRELEQALLLSLSHSKEETDPCEWASAK